MTSAQPVPITGLGCLCAAGPNLSACMQNLFGGMRVPRPPSRFSTTHPVRFPVFEIMDDLPLPGAGLSRTCRLALAAAHEAVLDAGLPPDLLRGQRVGVCIGTTVGCTFNNEEFYRDFRSGGSPAPELVRRFLQSNPASAIAREFDLNGPCQTLVNACSSGTDAIGIAADWIRSGICDIAIAGGADELSRVTYNGFISLLITDSAPCRPFDRDRKGLNLGEGAAMLVLESARSASGGNRPPRATVLGYGLACDAHHLTAPHPDGAGLKRAMHDALAQSGIDVGNIAFVNAHGTGTPDNDRVESGVLAEMLPGVPFLSTKGYTGHTLGAAGAIEAAFTVACLTAGRIPASAGFVTQDPALPVSPVRTVTAVRTRAAMSQSLAFGGNNGVLVIGGSPA
ncbi:MAG: beta-ketoacyl synthase [Lentisphaerae bacterium RIFOXYB12_FULL_65_16]|nr:MAG: beta-ketoacyl synthase [Lentisphaerae bacterium RIFOXYA12_64_32]OGV90016.1 MAG: beta-ketoacyl synthase [Lentisphaerae bacterium RIFOXYB12_FULL_65_16]